MGSGLNNRWAGTVFSMLAAGAATTAFAGPAAADQPPAPAKAAAPHDATGDSWWMQMARAGTARPATAGVESTAPAASRRIPVLLGETAGEGPWNDAPEPPAWNAASPGTSPQPALTAAAAEEAPSAEIEQPGELNAEHCPDRPTLSRSPVGSAVLATEPPNQRMRLYVTPLNRTSASEPAAAPADSKWGLPSLTSIVEMIAPRDAGADDAEDAPADVEARTMDLPDGPLVLKLQGGETVALRLPADCRLVEVKDEAICEIRQPLPERLMLTGRRRGSTHVNLMVAADGQAAARRTILVAVQSDAPPEAVRSASTPAPVVELTPATGPRTPAPVTPWSDSDGPRMRTASGPTNGLRAGDR